MNASNPSSFRPKITTFNISLVQNLKKIIIKNQLDENVQNLRYVNHAYLHKPPRQDVETSAYCPAYVLIMCLSLLSSEGILNNLGGLLTLQKSLAEFRA